MTPLERSLRTTARSLDRASLEALSNRGLVRRAEKDLERGGEVQMAGSEPDQITLRVGEWAVRLDGNGFARARCGCGASGVCQHVVMAVLFLQREEPVPAAGVSSIEDDVPEAPDAAAEWLSLHVAALTRWAGAPAFRQGLELASAAEAEIEIGAVVHVRFRARNVEVRLVPGTGLDGAITSGSRSGDDRGRVVAAVIQLQRSRGVVWEFPATGGALEEHAGAPRTRREVVEVCSRLAEGLVVQGLARLSAGVEPRLVTLGMSALAVNLPRLSHLLRAIGDEVTACRQRDARGDSGRLLAGLAELEALCGALRIGGDSPRADLVGVHRARFDEVGTIELSGVAAWPWETASGYLGLTVLFWDDSARAWNTWSESRTKSGAAGFDPVARFGFPGPWAGVDSPRVAGRSRVRLMRARRTGGGRLSVSSQTRGMILGPSEASSCGMPVLDDWTGVERVWRESVPVGLAPGNPLARVVALRIGKVGARAFDEVRQVLSWELADPAGHGVRMEVGFTPFQEGVIRCLEALDPAVVAGAIVVGRLERTADRWALFPFSVHPVSGAPIHLGFARTGPPSPEPGIRAVATHEPEVEEGWEAEVADGEDGVVPVCPPALARTLDRVDEILTAAAEGGVGGGGRRALAALPGLAAELRSVGWNGLASALIRLSAGADPGAALLRAAWISCALRRLGMRA